MAHSAEEQIFESLAVSSHLPAADLEEHLAKGLASIVGYAAHAVPFYRDRLSDVLGADGLVDQERWDSVKPLLRVDLQNHPGSLKSTRIPPGHGDVQERSTSGTTGKPVTVLITGRTKMTELALTGRSFEWAGIDPGLPLVILQGARHPLLKYRQTIPETWMPEWMAGVNPGGYSRLHYPMDAEEQLAYLAGQGPVYFNSQPSNFRRVLREAVERPDIRPDSRGFFSLGELVTADDRETARRVFKCEIIDSYSATEVGTIASQCSHGSLHVNCEIIRVETVRPDDCPCDEGEEGRILVTTLANAAMPLVRYDTGDIGVLGGFCHCGMTLPKLTLTVGRERSLFRFSDGSVAVPVFRMEKFSDTFPVTQWQLLQTGPEEVELRFSSQVPDDRLPYENIVAEIREAFGRRLGVVFNRHHGDMTSPSGKLEPALRLF